jgi:hypothetical protein
MVEIAPFPGGKSPLGLAQGLERLRRPHYGNSKSTFQPGSCWEAKEPVDLFPVPGRRILQRFWKPEKLQRKSTNLETAES